MRNRISTLILSTIALASSGERQIGLFTAIDLGRVEKGYDLRNKADASGVALNRTYIDVGFTDKLDDHNMLSVGVGGLFWKAYEAHGGAADVKVIRFGPGISRAYLEWSPVKNLSLDFGYFPYKYNGAAKNLGEYMFRSEAYPTILYTGGWSWMNDVQAHPVGTKVTYINESGTFKQDLGVFIEYFNSPIYDITPSYIATWKPSTAFTLGGGSALHRLITPTRGTKDELTKPFLYYKDFYESATPSSRVFHIVNSGFPTDLPYSISYSSEKSPNIDSLKAALFTDPANAPLWSAIGVASPAGIQLRQDTASFSMENGRSARYVTKLKSDIESDKALVDTALAQNKGQSVKSVSFDLSAVYLMAFFNLDFNALLGINKAKTGDFNLYGEVSQLGLKNYPIFYTEFAQRRPIMLGTSIPTFGICDNLSLEAEYLKNPNAESIASTYDMLSLPPDENYRYKVFTKDDIKWSIHASRKISDFATIFIQVANDHMRLQDGFATPQFVPVTNKQSDWYWLMRIQWMI